MSHTPHSSSAVDSVAEHLQATYDIEGLIADSSKGAVYQARQRSLDRDVAIRILQRSLSGIRAVASLAHPNLIRIYDSGEINGISYAVMEYVPGKSLRHSAKGSAIDPRQAVEIVRATCDGLAHAHENQIYHGNLTPAHILLTPKCEPKIGNFGLGGEAAYKAPESNGENEHATPAADVFALGVILHELLTGETHGGVVPDLRLAAICRKATHADPSQRYPDTLALAASLTRWLSPPKPVPSPTAIQSQRSSLHRPKPVVAASPGHSMVRNCAVIALLLFSIYGLWGLYQAKQERLARLQQQENAKAKVIIVRAQPADSSALVRWDP